MFKIDPLHFSFLRDHDVSEHGVLRLVDIAVTNPKLMDEPKTLECLFRDGG